MYINEQRKRIASLILGVLNARIYRAKYKYKKESITSYSLQPFLNLNTHKCYLLVGNTQSDDRLERVCVCVWICKKVPSGTFSIRRMQFLALPEHSTATPITQVWRGNTLLFTNLNGQEVMMPLQASYGAKAKRAIRYMKTLFRLN